MTKLSHIPMQIQKWIASLAHLFFLILGLIGISLMYINGNFGLGLTGIGSVPYEDTAEFNTQFNNDLNDIFLYMEYQDVFGADSSIDLSRRMLKMTFGPSETENFSLSSLISYLESMGYQLDDDFNCQKVSEPADGVKSREGYVEWSVQEPQRIYSYRSASRKRSTLEDAAVEIMDTLHRYYTVYNRFVANPSNLHFKIQYTEPDSDQSETTQFTNTDSLTPENQQIISDALDKLNYKENKVAKILANGQTEFVGVLIPSLSMNYYSEMLNQILASYEKYGYKFLVFAGNGHDETEHRYIQELMSYKIEGLIVLSHTLSSRELSDLQIPVVAIEREDQFVSSVNTDNYLGAYEATSLLIHNHCDVLIHLNSPTKENVPAYRRLAGFQDACVKAGVPHKVIIRDFGLSYQEAAAPLQEIFDNIEQKYAGQKKGIFLSNDDHANILLNLLIRKYHTLPDDYELIGFDGAPISEQAIYPISTVGQQIDQIADEAVSLLVSQMQERKKRHPVPLAEPVHKTVPPLLIRRQTTT